jgi:sensor c-di-GMP phosphodiesterase-like protein
MNIRSQRAVNLAKIPPADPLRILGPWMRVVAAIAFIVPIALIGLLSYCLALQQQEQRASTIAQEVLERQQIISTQTGHVHAALESHPSGDPCAPAQIALMRNLALGASFLQAVGYIRDDQLICSSFGNHETRIPVGPPDFLSAEGSWIRHAVDLQIGTHQKFFIVTDARSGYSTLELPDLLFDTQRANADAVVGLLGVSKPIVLVASGDVDLQRLRRPGRDAFESIWADSSGVGAIEQSPTHDYAGVALIPASSVHEAATKLAMSLAPVGLVFGGVSVVLVVLLNRQRMSLLARLKRAIRRNELSLAYMPIVDIRTGTLTGAEVLLRWYPPNADPIGPAEFIPVAEHHHLIGQVTDRMLAMFVEDARYRLSTCRDVRFSVNLSAEDFSDPSIVEKLLGVRQAAGIRKLTVEVTEGCLLDLAQAQSTIQRLRGLGIHVAIDDFGTGYSNLSYLDSLEVDYLKIEKSFVSAIGTGSVRKQIVDHIIEMAKDCGLAVVAEGVETQAQAEYLKASGVQYAQGWLFGKPMSASEFAEMARAALSLSSTDKSHHQRKLA